MTPQIGTCLIVFFIMIVFFAIGKIPLGVTAASAALLLLWTKCIDAATFLSAVGNGNTIIIVGMFVIGAGLKRTSLVKWLGHGVSKLTRGSFVWSYRIVILLGLLMTALLTSPAVAYSIMFPIMDAVNQEYNVSPSKTQFPMVLICIAGCAILPFGFAISEASVFNGLMETYGFTQGFTAMDFTVGRWPMLILIIAWAWFIAPKFTPESPSGTVTGLTSKTQETLPLAKDIAGMVIYVAVIACLIFGKQLGTTNWVVVFSGCMLLVLTGVLSGKEAASAMPIDMGMIFVGANTMAGALISTGAADFVGNLISNALGANPNPWVLSIVFFVVPFILTQFSLNQGIMNIFAPIALLTCRAIGADPRGCLVLICAGSLTAFLTPGATPAIPMVMGAGGYNLRDLFKMGWLFALMAMLFYIPYVTLVMPAF